MDLEQSLWSCSEISQSQRLLESLSGPRWVWVMAMMIWSGWDKNEVTRRGRGGPGTVLLVLEYVLVMWSGLGGFDWFRVGFECWMMAWTGWDRCREAR